MEKEFSYYVIEPIITDRTPLLMNDPSVDPKGINFLYANTQVIEGYVAYLQFSIFVKNPDMNVDYLFLESDAVFSNDVYLALHKYMPIESLQLVKAVINENGEEYNDFWIANVYREIKSFDEKHSTYDEIDRDDGMWFGIDKIVLDKELLKNIPLNERLVFMASEDAAFKLYHESIVDVIKSVNPKGMRFVPIEEWKP